MTTLLILILLKLFANPTLLLNLIYLKHSISIKIIIMLSTGILLSFLYQIVGNLTLNLIFPGLSSFSKLFNDLCLLFSHWSIPWLLLFIFGSSHKLNIRADFHTSLYTKDGMLSLNETAVCNFSDFHWHCICCSLTCLEDGFK